MMKKIGVEKERYNGLLNTDSFELLELNGRMNYYISRRDYPKCQEILKQIKGKLDLNNAENQRTVRLYEMDIERANGKLSAKDAIQQEKEFLKKVIDFDNNCLYHIPMRNEVLMINTMCVDLIRNKQVDEALKFWKIVIKSMEGSRVNVKHRYRSYALVISNYVKNSKTLNETYKVLNNELLCDKAAVLPICLAMMTKKTELETNNHKEFMPWAEKVYYISDLLEVEELRTAYGQYLIGENVKIII